MRDSSFYTDEELEVYDNYDVMNDVREMELFLEDCDDFKKDIIVKLIILMKELIY